jgi:hypothetical protein
VTQTSQICTHHERRHHEQLAAHIGGYARAITVDGSPTVIPGGLRGAAFGKVVPSQSARTAAWPGAGDRTAQDPAAGLGLILILILKDAC